MNHTNASARISSLVVLGILGIGKVKDDGRVRLSSSPVAVLLIEVDGAVEVERAVLLNIDPLRLEVGGRIDDGDGTRLQEIVGDQEMLLIWSDLDVVWSDNALALVGVVETFDVVEVGDIQGRNVIRGRQRNW